MYKYKTFLDTNKNRRQWNDATSERRTSFLFHTLQMLYDFTSIHIENFSSIYMIIMIESECYGHNESHPFLITLVTHLQTAIISHNLLLWRIYTKR